MQSSNLRRIALHGRSRRVSNTTLLRYPNPDSRPITKLEHVSHRGGEDVAGVLLERRAFNPARGSSHRPYEGIHAMKVVLKITSALLHQVRDDLRRPHPFASERVGFLTARCTRSGQGIVVLAAGYLAVPDNGYVPDETV